MKKHIKSSSKKYRALVQRMTLDEKLGMIHGAHLFRTEGVPRLGIPPLVMSDGTMGVRHEFSDDCWHAKKCSYDACTYLPCGSALAATWNRSLANKAGSVLGEEARGRGKDVILGPGVNLKRSPLCGRNFEYLSEDPLLASEMAAPIVRGIQKWDVAACVKHFAVNSQETERLWVDETVDEDVLRSTYLPAFAASVKKGGALTLMTAYNRLNGVHCCKNGHLLRDIARKEWGFDGLFISDWGGVHDTEETAKGELDIEMSVKNHFDRYFFADPLKEAVREGKVPEACIDDKVSRILSVMDQMHMLDGKRKRGAYNTAEHRRTALEAARESIVLLKNEDGILPLQADGIRRLLLVGDNADRKHAAGGGSAEIHALYEKTPYMGIAEILGGNTEILYAQGYCADENDERCDEEWESTSLENGGGAIRSENKASREVLEKRLSLRKEAVRMASDADAVIFVGGLNHAYDVEGADRNDLKLPYDQDALISELLEVCPETVVVLIGGSPVDTEKWAERSKAVVYEYYNGMEGGRALAEVLFGKVSPSGKLPESFCRKLNDYPAHALGQFGKKDRVSHEEGNDIGYRYLEKNGIEPRFPFGHGLSYTSFAYRNAEIGKDRTGSDRTQSNQTEVSCLVKNTGKCVGKETVQLYLRKISGTGISLAGFEKIELKPGEETRVSFTVEGDMKKKGVWCLGSSSRDIRLEVRRKA